MRDAYIKLFEHYPKDQLFEDGLSEIIFPGDKLVSGEELVSSVWADLFHRVLNNEEVWIRGYGQNGKGSNKFQRLYWHLFGNSNVQVDPNNNSEPTKLLASLTKLSKTVVKDGEQFERIVNYQVGHVFGMTKNPFLFTAPWNIAYVPKYLDPFTGHESKGEYVKEFTHLVKRETIKRYEKHIKEYNRKIMNVASDIPRAILSVKEELSLSGPEFARFEKNVREELSPIPLIYP
jgi:hypothetical protein